MATARGRKRRFGSVRKLPSGRFQARYPGPDGLLRTAEETFETQTAADEHLVDIEADMRRKEWIDPNAGKVSLREYADRWIGERECTRLSVMSDSWWAAGESNPGPSD